MIRINKHKTYLQQFEDHKEDGSSVEVGHTKIETREFKPLAEELGQCLYVSEKSNGEIEMEFK